MTRFRPADPEAVRRRFEAIRLRALERVAEERRALLAKLRNEPVAPGRMGVVRRPHQTHKSPDRSATPRDGVDAGDQSMALTRDGARTRH
jgi:hypothetical protein